MPFSCKGSERRSNYFDDCGRSHAVPHAWRAQVFPEVVVAPGLFVANSDTRYYWVRAPRASGAFSLLTRPLRARARRI